MNTLNQTFNNPSLTLYAFHLLSDVWNERRDDANQLWQTLANLAVPLAMPELENFTQLLELENEQGRDTRFLRLLSPPVKAYQTNELTCQIEPLRLHDIHAVDLTVFIKDKPLALTELSRLNPQGCLLPTAINASLGQTLLFYAETVSLPDETLARQCVRALWEQSGQPLPKFAVEQGQLFGSPLFECEAITDIETSQATHILIWFGINPQTLNLAGKANYHLIKLLNNRHKILYVSQKAKQSYKDARSLYRELELKSQRFRQPPEDRRERLKVLENLLREMPEKMVEYIRHLRNLNDHKTTLLADKENYDKSLADLLEFSLPDDNPSFLQAFKVKANRIHQQIEINLTYLGPGQTLFQQLTHDVQGLSQIETLKHEFNKQERLEYLVVGIASALESAAISVKVDYGHHLAQHIADSDSIIITLLKHLTSILTHLSIGIPFALSAVGLLWLLNRLKQH